MSSFAQAICPNCGGTVMNDGSLSGQTVACPFCSASFQMPAFAAGASTTQPFTTPAPQGAPGDAVPFAAASPYTGASSSALGGQAFPVGPGIICPHCRAHVWPLVRKEISSAGIAVLIVLAITCLPLFWIGFLIQEEIRECGNCRMRL